MLIVGDKIKQTKALPGYDRIGDVFEVTTVQDAVISFQTVYGCGIMSYNEYETYFEKVIERHWTKWIHTEQGDAYRTNGKRVEIKCAGLKATASCRDEDTFSLDIGLALARARLQVKYALRMVDKHYDRCTEHRWLLEEKKERC